MVEPLTRHELAAIHFIETYWHEFSEFPSLIAIDKEIPECDMELALEKDLFLKSLTARGIFPPVGPQLAQYVKNKPTKQKSSLTPAQTAAVLLLTDFRDRRSQGAKLKSIGVSTTQWNAWLKNSHFKQYLYKLSKKNFEDSIEVAHAGLLGKVAEGDVSAIKFYMELTGEYGGEASTIQNLKMVITRLVESIQKHVRDPEVIAAIEQDFRLITSGQIPTSTPVGKADVQLGRAL